MTTQAVVVELTEMAAEADYITQQIDHAYDKLEDAEELLRGATDLNEYKTAMKSLI
jgi:predicted  nucleic acid-binding Zn-ribbon protein